MMHNCFKSGLIILAGVLASVVFSCGQGTAVKNERLRVMVTIPPQVYFVEKIGGDNVEVQTVQPPGKDPHFIELTTRDISAVFSSDIYFSIGLPQEKTLLNRLKESAKTLRIVDLTESVSLRMPDEPFFSGNNNHETDVHQLDENKDPHIWLSPRLVKMQAKTIRDVLIDTDPENTGYYTAHYNQFISEVDALDIEISEILSSVKDKTLLVYHPAFGYFADEYGFTQVPVEIEGKEPAARGLSMLIDFAKTRNIRALFIDPGVSRRKAQIIAASIGAEIVEVDPLSENWDTLLVDMALKIKLTGEK